MTIADADRPSGGSDKIRLCPPTKVLVDSDRWLVRRRAPRVLRPVEEASSSRCDSPSGVLEPEYIVPKQMRLTWNGPSATCFHDSRGSQT